MVAFGESAETNYATAETEVRELTVSLRNVPQKASLWRARGEARLKMSDPVGALADFSEAIRLAPFEPEYRLSRAKLLAAQGRWAEVVADATDGLAADPKGIELLVLRAHARRSLGLLDLALSDCNSALAVLPNSVDALLDAPGCIRIRPTWPGFWKTQARRQRSCRTAWKRSAARDPR